MDNKSEDNRLQDSASVPYIVYEGEMARNERHINRLIIALVITIGVLFVTNLAWLKAWTMYDYSSEETSVDVIADSGGTANYVGNDGDIVNGTNTGSQEEANQNP